MPSDSNYTAVKRFTRRQPLSKVSIPQAIVDTSDINSNQHSNPDNDTDNYDDDYNCWRNWAADTLSDDEIETSRSEAAVAPLLEEGELDADAIVVSPTGNSASAANNAAERRRREEGWNDLGLDQIDSQGRSGGNGAVVSSSSQMNRGMNNQQE